MKIDRDPTVTSNHKGHHLKNAKGEVVQTFSNDREGLRKATHTKYKLFKKLDLPPMDKDEMNEDKLTKVDPSKAIGTGLQGRINVSYFDLLKVIGIPHIKYEPHDGDKVDVEWVFELPNGNIVTLYNWKDGKVYDSEHGLDVEDITDWHIGAQRESDADEFIDYIKKQIIRKEDKDMSDLDKKLEDALTESITVNTMSDTDPNSEDTVTITATGDDATEILNIIKLAGINQPTEEQPETDPSMADIIQIIPLDDAEDEVVEELANTPNDAMDLEGDVDTMVNKISGGLNKRKNAYKKAQDGDNAMAVKEDEEDLTETYLREYDEFKVTAPEDSDEGDWEIENIGKWAVKIGSSKETEATADELGFDTELAAELADEAMTEAEDEDLDEGLRIEYKDGTCAGSKCPDDRNRDKMKVKGEAPEEFDKPKKATPPKSDALDKEMSEEVESDEDNVKEGLRIVRKSDGKCIGGYCDDKSDKLTGNVNDDDDEEDDVDEGAGCKSKKKVKEDIEKQELDIDENELEESTNEEDGDMVFVARNHNGTLIAKGDYDYVKKDSDEYTYQTGNFCTIDKEKEPVPMHLDESTTTEESTNEKESVNLGLIKKLAGI